ncbi:MAG: regulator of sigma E protease [Glaciecola sp.]|jgi:regulator of sigma E protease
MEIVNQIGQLLFSLSFLIILHEMGHFIPAKLFKIKVEKFYLFFDPYFSLVKKKIGETTYGIGWLPLGGYVKIAGMIDESMDKEAMEKEPEDWEFRSKPAWQRLVVMLGGVTVNAILAVGIFIIVMFVWGQTVVPNKSLADGIWVTNDSLSVELGMQTGDKIIAIDNENCEDVDVTKVMNNLIFSKTMTIERNGKRFEHQFPDNFIELLQANKDKGKLFELRMPFEIGEVPDSGNAYNAGLLKGDVVLLADSVPIKYFDEFKTYLERRKGESVSLTVEREGRNVPLNVNVNEKGKIGIAVSFISLEQLTEEGILEVKNIKYSFLEAIPAGFAETGFMLQLYTKNFMKIFDFKSKAYKSVGGFKAFGSMFSKTWDWESTWRNTAFISIILAFMNLLPIPALDGGHAMFLGYEILTGRKPHEKLMEYAQIAGMILLLLVVVAANINDWI